ncbi:MAG: stress response protein [Deinococcota bacterium]|jgi:tellurium resistance protein TerZ
MAISLTKGQAISLEKTTGATLTQVKMGLGWDVAKPKGLFGAFTGGNNSIDLDASCLMFDGNGQNTDIIYFRQLKSKDGSVQHMGDNLTGAGDGDDEVIKVDLTKVPSNVAHLVFTVSSYRGQSFDKVENAYCRLLDHNNKEVAKFNLSAQGSHTGQIMVKLSRQGSDWNLHAIGHNTQSSNATDLVNAAKNLL